jgi:hypothetical protein
MIFAQISNGVIVNTIHLMDGTLLSLFQNDPSTGLPYDTVLQINFLYPQPGIGWIFDGIQFYPPPAAPDPDDGGDL